MAQAKTGQEQKAITNSDVLLDFSGLFSPPEEPPESGLGGQQAIYIQTTGEKKDRESFSEVCEYYQDNIKKSECLQMEILKGVQAEENIYSLFLKACEAISLMTGNRLFFEQTKRDLEGKKYEKGMIKKKN